MAFWKDSVGRIAQNAVVKSKEMAEITRLNMEISNTEQKIKELQIVLGEYLVNHPEICSDAEVAQNIATIHELREKIEKSKQNVLEIRNINICPGCGAEVDRSSKFCDRCGTEMKRTALEQVEEITCANCGAKLDRDAAFCGNCGCKVEK